MTLRSKTGLVIGITSLAMMVILYALSRVIVNSAFRTIEKQFINGFLHVESEDGRKNIQRVLDAYKVHKNNMLVKAADWAKWDDTYRFVADRNEAYSKSNLTVETLDALKVDLIAIIDTSGNEVYRLLKNNNKGLDGTIDTIVQHYQDAWDGTDSGSVSGLVSFNGQPMLVASLPILRSDNSGPVRGMFSFGKYVDDDFFAELAAVTHLNISWRMYDSSAGVADTITEMPEIVRVNNSIMVGNAVLHDIKGKPMILITVKMPREIYSHGSATLASMQKRNRWTMLMLIISMTVMAIVLWGAIFIVLEKIVLLRLKRISYWSDVIRSKGTVSETIPVDGNDEIASLAISMNKMLESLQQSHEHIVERDREKMMLMNAVPIGLFSLDDEYKINPEHSRMLLSMFGVQDCIGRHINDLLALTGNMEEQGTDLISFLDLVRKQILPEKDLFALNPIRELHFTSRGFDVWYELGFYVIDRGGSAVPYILVTVVDITDEKVLNLEMDAMQQENIQLKRIAENPDFFMEFMRETRDIIRKLEKNASELVPGKCALKTVAAMFRGMHTIKGVAGSFGLKNIENITSEGEDCLGSIVEKQVLTENNINDVKNGISLLNELFGEVVLLSSGLLGDVFDEEVIVRIAVTSIDKKISDVQSMAETLSVNNPQAAAIAGHSIKLLRQMKMAPAEKMLGRSLRILPSLNDRLGKRSRIRLNCGGVRIDHEMARALNVVVLHMLRNAVDHGIEDEEQRLAAGKDLEGVISIDIAENEGQLVLRISDDGRGFDVAKITAAAIENGFIDEQRAAEMSAIELCNLIFLPGLSTSGTITEISGRGVGLDAVMTMVREELHGTVCVDFKPGQGAAFVITIPYA